MLTQKKNKFVIINDKVILGRVYFHKDLAKEDALSLVSEFVKDVKKKFPNKEDKLEILRDASKTLDFYINEIENTSSIDIMSAPMGTSALSFDDLVGSGSDEEETSYDEEEGGEE